MAKKVVDKFTDIASQIQLVDVRMLECRCAEPKLEEGKLPSNLELPTAVEIAIDRETHALKVEVFFRLFAGYSEPANGPTEKNSALFMSAKFRLLFRFSEAIAKEEQKVADVTQRSAVMAAWPLWREFVLSMAGRLGLPPLPLPLMNIQKLLGNMESHHEQKLGVEKKRMKAQRSKRSPKVRT